MHPQPANVDPGLAELTQPGERGPAPAPTPQQLALASADTEHGGDLGGAPTLGSDVALRLDGPLPTRLGRYLVINKLGAGGMGVVLAAYDPELDRKVAIKLLRAGPSDDASARLLREAQALARLSHPHVVQIYDAGAHDRQIFIAMELVDGLDLRRWLAAGTRPWRAILRVFTEAGRGLAAAHAVGIIHRDFKPENVLVGADGRARVADFGLARQLAAAIETTAVDPPRLGASALDISLTMSGTVLGTPAYMAPEQLDGRPADARSDLFSFCVALFEALYGVRPYAGETLGALLNNLHQGKLSEVPASSQAPRRIAAALRRGLASDPRLRPASLEALLAELTYEPALRRRWGAFAGGLALAASAATYAFAAATTAPGPAPCSGGEAAIADLWSPTAARSLAADLADVIPSASARERATTGLDAYASGWVAARREACLAHHRGDDPAPARDARMRCLDRRRDALGGALRLLQDARPSDDIARVVAGLPALDACARIDALLVDPAAHRAPELAAAAAPHLRQLDQTRALADAGRLDEARAALRATYEAAISLPDRALHAQIGLARARLEMAAGDWPTAAAQLRLALADAVASDDHGAAAEAIARLLYARALTDQESPAAILADAPLAHALVDRLGPGSFASRRLWGNLAFVHFVAGDQVQVDRWITRAVDDLAAVVDADPIESANLLSAAASLTRDPQRRSDAFDRAAAILRRELGDDHPDLLVLHLHRGRAALDLHEATEHIEAACAGYRRLAPDPGPDDDPSCAECGLLLGDLEVERGRPAVALTRYDDAATCDAGRATTPEQQAKIDSRRELARAHAELLRGRPAEAIAAAERHQELLAPYFSAERWWLELPRVAAWMVLAEAHRQRGDRPAARAALESAHAALVRLEAVDSDALARYWRARAAAQLAAHLEGDDDPAARDRARQLVLEARAFHASRGADGAAELLSLDTWLNSHLR
jgi:tRNA A-37 threonylcarbamoyl transferase component Bud32/tetratricopeptide (TPR) repeat protein